MAKRIVAIRRDLIPGGEKFTAFAQSPRGTKYIVRSIVLERGTDGRDARRDRRASLIETLLMPV